MENFVSIDKSSSLWQGDTIPLASCVGRWYLYKFMQFVPLLMFKDLAKVPVQGKKYKNFIKRLSHYNRCRWVQSIIAWIEHNKEKIL